MIEFHSVTKTYPGIDGDPVDALRDVDLSVRPGEFVVVVGPSGSGKSTLLAAAGGMLQPTEGRVLFDGTEVYGLSSSERAALRRRRVGFIFQTFNLIPYLNCLENTALPAFLEGKPQRTCLERARELLEGLGLGHRLNHKPAELSVGERQRAAICRSLINKPDVILADEPTGNLDTRMTDEVADILRRLNADGQTIIMATHDLRLSRKGTRVITIEEGRVRGDRKISGARARPKK